MIVSGQDRFWKDYPADEEGFDACVRDGIYVHSDQEQSIDDLPAAPDGYCWVPERGGICFRCYTYRLWHPKFGYMPQSE